MKKYLDKTRHRLVFIEQVADEIFWDKHWKTDEQHFTNHMCLFVMQKVS